VHDPPPRWQPPAPWEVAATAGIPLAGTLWFDWSGEQILLLYWLENVLEGIFNLLRLALSQPVYENRADYLKANPWLLQHYPVSSEDWQKARLLEVPAYPGLKAFLVPLFFGHYGFFLLIHGFLIATLVGGVPARDWWTFASTQWSTGMTWSVASLFATHGWRFWTEDLQGRTHTRTCPFLAMVYPYRRLLVLHITLFLGGFALVSWSLPSSLAILLVLLKTGFDQNWIRIPLGPARIEWSRVSKKHGRQATGTIVNRSVNERPPDCHAQLKESLQQTDFELRPRGIREVWKTMRAGGCLVVGGVFLGAISFIGALVGAEHARTLLRGGADHYWILLLVMNAAQLIGTLWLLAFTLLASILWEVIAYGTRHGRITLTRDTLAIRQGGFPWPRSRDLPAHAIADIGMSRTGNKTNGFEVVELRIRMQDGREHTFFRGRDAEELCWIATRITHHLVAM
jgi:hypothetical protein